MQASLSTATTILQLRPLLLPLFTILIPQEPSQDLPTGTLRNDLHELNTTGQPLVFALLFLDMPCNGALDGALGHLHFDIRILDYKSLGYLARSVIWNGNDTAVVHILMGKQMRFEFCGSDLETLGTVR